MRGTRTADRVCRMSYDLAVWEGDRPATDSVATEMYE